MYVTYRIEDIITYLGTICYLLAVQHLFHQPNAALWKFAYY